VVVVVVVVVVAMLVVVAGAGAVIVMIVGLVSWEVLVFVATVEDVIKAFVDGGKVVLSGGLGPVFLSSRRVEKFSHE